MIMQAWWRQMMLICLFMNSCSRFGVNSHCRRSKRCRKRGLISPSSAATPKSAAAPASAASAINQKGSYESSCSCRQMRAITSKHRASTSAASVLTHFHSRVKMLWTVWCVLSCVLYSIFSLPISTPRSSRLCWLDSIDPPSGFRMLIIQFKYKL